MLITGLIAAWGTVWVHENGFRAEKAKVMAFLRPKMNRKVMNEWIGDELTLEAILWEEWISSTLPSLAEDAGIPVLEDQELPDYVSDCNLRSFD